MLTLIFLDISEPFYAGLGVNNNLVKVTYDGGGYEPESLNVRRLASYSMGTLSPRAFYIDTIRKFIYAFYGGGLVVYNISNPYNPSLIYKNTNTPFFTSDIWLGTVVWSVED